MSIPKIKPAERRVFEEHLLSSRCFELLNADFAKGAWLDLLIPEVRAEMGFFQNTRYHAYTNLEHSLRVAASLPPTLDERLAGLFHDIGKRRTMTIKERNGDEQYLGHEIEGAKMVQPILARLGYDPELIGRVARWIYWHMTLHTAANNAGSPKAQAKVLLKIEDDLAVLERLQIADIEAMNPQLITSMKGNALAYHRLLAETIAQRDAARTTDCRPAPPVQRQQARPIMPSLPVSARTLRTPTRRPLSPVEIEAVYLLRAQERTEELKASGQPFPQSAGLVVVTGLPASGKTYFADRLAREGNFFRVSTDDIRMDLTGNAPTYSGPEHMLTHGTGRQVASALLARGYRVIIDSTGIVPSDRRHNIDLGRKVGIPTTLIWCKVDESIASGRLAQRVLNRDSIDLSEADTAVRNRMAVRATTPTPIEADLVMIWTPPTEEGVWGKLRAFYKF
jgi:putative nucleotidyltransferase with HDIG domain